MDFSVYREGRRSARHVPAEYEGAPGPPGSPWPGRRLFGLSPEMEKALRTVFQRPAPSGACAFRMRPGLPLWVDGEFLADAQPPEPDCRDYLAQKAAERKIKNATKPDPPGRAGGRL